MGNDKKSSNSIISQAEQKAANKTATIEKVDFEAVNAVNDALFLAFHPEMLGEDDDFGMDESEMSEEEKELVSARETKFFAMWELFLGISGWTNELFWEEVEQRKTMCPHCGETKQHLEEDDLELDMSSPKVISDANKPN